MLYSSRQTAKKLAIDLRSLSRYIAAKKISAPKLTRVGGVKVRLWTDEDIAAIRKLLPNIPDGRKTRYQKLKQQTKKKT